VAGGLADALPTPVPWFSVLTCARHGTHTLSLAVGRSCIFLTPPRPPPPPLPLLPLFPLPPSLPPLPAHDMHARTYVRAHRPHPRHVRPFDRRLRRKLVGLAVCYLSASLALLGLFAAAGRGPPPPPPPRLGAKGANDRPPLSANTTLAPAPAAAAAAAADNPAANDRRLRRRGRPPPPPPPPPSVRSLPRSSSSLSPFLLLSPLARLLLPLLPTLLLGLLAPPALPLPLYPLLASEPARPALGLALLQVGETAALPAGAPEGLAWRWLRADSSLLGGRWVGQHAPLDQIAEDDGGGAGGGEERVGDSIFSAFVLQEAYVRPSASSRSSSLASSASLSHPLLYLPSSTPGAHRC